MERPPEQLGGRCPNKGQKGRPKGKGKSKSVGPGKGRGKQENPKRGRSSGSRRITVREEEEGRESQSHTSAHHTAFHDRRGRIRPQGQAAAQARWKHQEDPLSVNQGKPKYRQTSFGPRSSGSHPQHNSIFDAYKKHYHTVKGQKIYVLHKSELSEHMEEYNRIGGPCTVVSFTYDQDYPTEVPFSTPLPST